MKLLDRFLGWLPCIPRCVKCNTIDRFDLCKPCALILTRQAKEIALARISAAGLPATGYPVYRIPGPLAESIAAKDKMALQQFQEAEKVAARMRVIVEATPGASAVMLRAEADPQGPFHFLRVGLSDDDNDLPGGSCTNCKRPPEWQEVCPSCARRQGWGEPEN